MGIDVSIDGEGKWVDVPKNHVKFVDDIDDIIICKQLAMDLLQYPEQYNERTELLEPPRKVISDGAVFLCDRKVTARWRWMAEGYTRGDDLFVTSEVEGGRILLLMPRSKNKLQNDIGSVKPLYHPVQTEEEKTRQREDNAQADAIHKNVRQTSSKSKTEKFTALYKDNASTAGEPHQGTGDQPRQGSASSPQSPG